MLSVTSIVSWPISMPASPGGGLDAGHEAGLAELPRGGVHEHPDRRAVHLLGVPLSGLPAGLAERPLAHRHDQAGGLGQRQEVARQHGAALGVLPADQRLDGGDGAGADVHDRLVAKRELLVLDRVLELLAQRAALAAPRRSISRVPRSMCPGPRSLALCIAMSARWRSSSESPSETSPSANPMLQVGRTEHAADVDRAPERDGQPGRRSRRRWSGRRCQGRASRTRRRPAGRACRRGEPEP